MINPRYREGIVASATVPLSGTGVQNDVKEN